MSADFDLAPPRFNMAAYCLAASVHRTPEKPALLVVDDAAARTPSEVWTYAEIEDAVLRTGAALRAMGHEPGDRIMIRLDNTSAFAVLFFAAIAAGLVALPTSSQLTEREALFLLEDSGAQLIASAEHLALSHLPSGVRQISPADVERMMRHGTRADYAQTAAEDPAFLIYTSGT